MLTAWGVVGVGQFVTGGGMEHIGQDKKDRYTPKTQEYKHFDRMQRQGRELMIGGLVRTAQGSAGALVGLALWAAVPPVRRPEDNKVVSVIITL